MKIVTVLGTRPEIIKTAALMPLLDEVSRHVIVHTGQHYDERMDSWFFSDLGLRSPDYHLGAGSGSHATQLSRMLLGLEPILQDVQPDWVVVQGDTNSTLAGGLAAAKLGFKVAHVEAGCRSFNRQMPEEINRVVVDHLSSICFAPDESALSNLAAEGIAGDGVQLVGSTGVDACLRMSALIGDEIADDERDLPSGEFLLATIHRAENTTPEMLPGLIAALGELAEECPVLFPVHPRTAQALEGIPRPENVRFIQPVGYRSMISLLKRCRALLTDSGGLQEEAAVLGAPTFILRNETEWPEFVESGTHKLAGSERESIVNSVRLNLDRGLREARMREEVGIERAGAAKRICGALVDFESKQEEIGNWKRHDLVVS